MTKPCSRKTGRYFVLLLALAGLCLLLAVPCVTVYHQYRAWSGDQELVSAAAGGNAAKVRRLLSRGSHANSYHPEGSSALWWAVSSGNPECVRLLLQYGADPNSRGQFNSVIDQAVQDLDGGDEQAQIAIAQALLDRAPWIKDAAQVHLLKKALTTKRARLPGRRPLAVRKP